MKILTFVEGADLEKGLTGIIGVTESQEALANRGHYAVMCIAGSPPFDAERFAGRPLSSILTATENSQRFGILTFPIWNFPLLRKWQFAPKLFWQINKHVKEFDFIQLHSLYSFPVFAGYLLARLHKKPYAFWSHSVLAPFQRTVGKRHKKIYDFLAGKRILNNAALSVFTAEGERLETDDLNLKPASVIIPWGLDTEAYQEMPPGDNFRKKYFDDHPGPIVLYVGRLAIKKGLDLLIEAIALVSKQIPDVRLALVGSGDPVSFTDQVKSWLKQYKIEDRTVLTGFLRGQDKVEAFAAADVFAITSQAENFCAAMFEAMAGQIPVVVADTLNYAQEIETHQTGIVVRREAEDIAAAIIKLLRNPEMRQQMGAKGITMAQSYTWDRNAERGEAAMSSVLEHQPLPKDLSPRPAK